jgi:hypothetical protein
MPVYTGEDFSGQTVTLTEQTQFVRCNLAGANIEDNAETIGWELLDCIVDDLYVNGVLRG